MCSCDGITMSANGSLAVNHIFSGSSRSAQESHRKSRLRRIAKRRRLERFNAIEQLQAKLLNRRHIVDPKQLYATIDRREIR
ncbi:unnamed protein product [Caenorhabditis sp. 36 PRJEB53466]|nr:unnamed protein product [Caenorhabditis sp. 36 PRJEB53466]